ncbi:MAG: hypothetical protein S4CHLAM2_08620 [Chlamydiales bacterium]|nr:hypothetical protein [Chlamydiales bacterium]
MLHFFRKHQKYFFLFTTIIIVTSFAFFGTYQAFAPTPGGRSGPDEVVFHCVDGKAVRQSYLDHMALFLEREEWMQSSKLFDANYLNDGVISKDFLESGLSKPLLTTFAPLYHDQLLSRFEKEQNYTPYKHPYIPTLTADAIWALFAPEIPEKLAALQASADPVESFESRVELFLAERNFPPAFLTQVMRYQENDAPRAPRDPRLMKDVVSLFGYRNHSDWFGEKFVQNVAEVVINTAAIARQKGYSVSYEEALTDLLFKSQKTYAAIAEHATIPVESGEEFFRVYLSQKGLDEPTAVRIWEEITLFRRMMQEVGSAALVDTLPLEQFYAYAHEKATVELCQMAPELRLSTEEEAQSFQVYLTAVAPSATGEIPLNHDPIEVIAKRAPELVGSRYRLYIGAVNKEALQGKVSVKETWDWEVANWDTLLTVFPELAQKEGTPFERLEKVDKRERIDAYARLQIIEQHPEWVDEAVRQADMREQELFLSRASENEPLAGVSDRLALQKVLDEQNEILGFTQDQKNYYRIIVDERASEPELLTFKEAKKQGLLKPIDQKGAVSFAAYLETYCQAPAEGTLASQWVIEKKEKSVTRAAESFLSLDTILALDSDQFSAVAQDEKEGPYCFRVKEVMMDTTIPMQKWMEAQELLAKEMRSQFFENMLGQLCSKNLSH